jgi:hypothetical protein
VIQSISRVCAAINSFEMVFLENVVCMVGFFMPRSEKVNLFDCFDVDEFEL